MRAVLALALALAFASGSPARPRMRRTPGKRARVPRPHRPDHRPGVAALEAIGAANDFAVDATADAAQLTAGEPRELPRRRVPQHGRQPARHARRRPRVQAFVQGGGGFVGIGSAAQGEVGSTAFDQLHRRAPEDRQPDGRDRADRRRRRPRPPRDARPPARRCNRSDAWYQWQTRPTGTRPHASPATTRRTRPPATAPTSAARITRSRGAATSRTAAPSTRAWAAPPAATARTNFTKHLGGALQWAAGLVRGGCKATINSNYSHRAHRQRRRDQHRAAVQRRVARPHHRAERLGPLHRPRRLPHRPGARRAARPARARPHPRPLQPERRHRLRLDPRLGPGAVQRHDELGRHARRDAGGLRRRRHRRRAHRTTATTRWSTACWASPSPRTSPTPATSTSSTSRPSTRESSPPGLGVDRRISKMSRPRISRFTMDLDDQADRPQLRGADLRVRRADLQLLPRRRRHGLRLRGQPLRDHG